MRKCKDCHWLRSNLKLFDKKGDLLRTYSGRRDRCNRYPQGIYRSPEAPACGEFKKARRWWTPWSL